MIFDGSGRYFLPHNEFITAFLAAGYCTEKHKEYNRIDYIFHLDHCFFRNRLLNINFRRQRKNKRQMRLPVYAFYHMIFSDELFHSFDKGRIIVDENIIQGVFFIIFKRTILVLGG